MNPPTLVMGIDLGSSGVRIAVLYDNKELIHSASTSYKRGLSFSEDWKESTKELILGIPRTLRKDLAACAVDGTSGTLLACTQDGESLGEALPYYVCCPEEKLNLAKILPLDYTPIISPKKVYLKSLRLNTYFLLQDPCV